MVLFFLILWVVIFIVFFEMFLIDEFILLFVIIDNNVSNNVNGVDEDKIKMRERLWYYWRIKIDIISFVFEIVNFMLEYGIL